MRPPSNLGLVHRFRPPSHEPPLDYVHDEPTNEELGIEPVTGWRLVLVWAIGTAVSGAVLALGAIVLVEVVSWLRLL